MPKAHLWGRPAAVVPVLLLAAGPPGGRRSCGLLRRCRLLGLCLRGSRLLCWRCGVGVCLKCGGRCVCSGCRHCIRCRLRCGRCLWLRLQRQCAQNQLSELSAARQPDNSFYVCQDILRIHILRVSFPHLLGRQAQLLLAGCNRRTQRLHLLAPCLSGCKLGCRWCGCKGLGIAGGGGGVSCGAPTATASYPAPASPALASDLCMSRSRCQPPCLTSDQLLSTDISCCKTSDTEPLSPSGTVSSLVPAGAR